MGSNVRGILRKEVKKLDMLNACNRVRFLLVCSRIKLLNSSTRGLLRFSINLKTCVDCFLGAVSNSSGG